MTGQNPDAHIVRCPGCGRPSAFTAANPARPFCSERCQLIDLGAWADEQHAIPGNPAADEVMSEDLD